MSGKKRKKAATTKLRVAIYARVSTQRQANEGDSLEAQQNAILRYIEDRKQFDGWQVDSVTSYVDAGKSGKNLKRPQLQRLQNDILQGKIDVVISSKLDRISRSVRDFLNLWDFFEEAGVELVILKEKFDTSHPAGEFLMLILIGFAQMERKFISDRTQTAMNDRISRGLWNGGRVHGYIPDPEGSGKLVPEPEWSMIIRERFFDALERLGSAGAVQRELCEKWKLTVPKRRTRSGRVIGGDFFEKQQVTRILRNPIYIGRLTWGELSQDDCHEPIISKEQFERVQRILDETTKHRSNRRKSRGRGYPLRGLVRCGCGAMMTPKGAHGRNGKYHYYECTRKNHVGRTVCRASGIPAEALEDAVAARVAEIGTSEEARKEIISQALKLIDANAHAAEQESMAVRNRLTAVKAEIGRLVAVLKEMGTGVLESIRDELARLEQEKRDLQDRLEELQEEKTPLDQVMALAKKFIENWPGVGDLLKQATGDEQRVIIEQHVEVIQLTPTAPDGKSGTYVLRLFPEATPDRETGNGVLPVQTESANGDPVLTESPPVREVSEKAPREQP